MKSVLTMMLVLTALVSAQNTAPKVQSQAVVTIPSTEAVDLETGKISYKADLWFESAAKGIFHVRPLPGVGLSKIGTKAPGFQGCRHASFSSTPVSIRDLPGGSYLCVR